MSGVGHVFCGIDVGTQGVRTLLIDGDGTVLGEGVAPLTAGARRGSEHTQDPSAWWTALIISVRDALAAARSGPGASEGVEAIALDATSGTVLVQQADGSASGSALMYDDSRAAEQAIRAQRAGQALWDELGYRIQPSWALPKAMWLAEHDAVGAGDRIVHQSDYLVRRLAGHSVATDISNALKTGVDLRTGTWPEDIHASLGLRSGLFPAVVRPGTVIAAVGAEAAAATGLAEGTPIRAGMTDGCAAQIASGALAPGSWSSALGTTLVIKGSTRSLIHDPSGAVYSHRHPDGGWLPGGASSTGAGAIAAVFPNATQAELAALTTDAAALVPIGSVVYPLTGNGERFPFIAPQARGFGLAELSTDALRFGALCQGIAYVERLAYDVLRTLGADVSGAVSLTGGTTGNAWWNQLRTDVLGRDTIIPASAQAAFGMAVLAAAEPGQLTATAERVVHVEQVLRPDARRGAELGVGYRSLVGALADRGWLDPATASDVLNLVEAS